MEQPATFDAAEAFLILNGDYPTAKEVSEWTAEDVIKLQLIYDYHYKIPNSVNKGEF
jgi:hypothetical protein